MARVILAVSIIMTQILPIDAAWHNRGVLTRQLRSYALIRPDQYAARQIVNWINVHARTDQNVVFTPHAGDAWLALVPHHNVARLEQLNVYRTPNLVYDRAGMVAVLRDSIRSADWVVTNPGTVTEGLADGLVTELVVPQRMALHRSLSWEGIPMQLVASFGTMRLYKLTDATPVSR